MAEIVEEKFQDAKYLFKKFWQKYILNYFFWFFSGNAKPTYPDLKDRQAFPLPITLETELQKTETPDYQHQLVRQI